MTLTVHSLCGYPSLKAFKDADHKPDQAHWAARNLVLSIKGEQFKGYSDITFSGSTFRIDQNSRSTAISIFGQWAAAKLRKLKRAPAALVPIPSSKLTSCGGQCTASMLANEISSHAPAFPMRHILGFKEARESDHGKRVVDGGEKPRRQSKDEILRNLKHNGSINAEHAILIDDVCTQGFHLLAAASYLRNLGVTVDCAICVGRTIWAPDGSPFTIKEEDLEESIFSFLED